MCYMPGADVPSLRTRANAVGVRELRQNLSVYLDRVKQGEALEVTEHGRVVAVLRPVGPIASRLDVLIAQGLVSPAHGTIRDLPPPRRLPAGAPLVSQLLEVDRTDRL